MSPIYQKKSASKPESQSSTNPSDTASTVQIATNHTASTRGTDVPRTSTERYGGYDRPPYDHFEVQVKELCQLLWPISKAETTKQPLAKRMRKQLASAIRYKGKPSPSQSQSLQASERFIIERMRGGSYNQIVGITIIDPTKDNETRVVLRVPREDMNAPKHDVTILQFVNEYAFVPLPEVLSYDFTEDNPLGKPYLIQKRIPGHDLESKTRSYPDLTHQQKLLFVEEFCQILVKIQGIEHPYAGQIDTSTDEKGAKIFTVSPFEVFFEDDDLIARRAEELPFFKVRTFGADESSTPDDWSEGAETNSKSPLYFFHAQFGRWRTNAMSLDASRTWDPARMWVQEPKTRQIYERLATAASQMNEFALLDCESFCLTHWDLDPRNIMLDIRSDGTPKISAILDWDLAMFAPKWVSCKPPMWIWNWLDGGSEDETKANEEPPTAEQKELKELFDDCVGFHFRWDAYQPHCRLARQLFRFAYWGCDTIGLQGDAETFLEEWAALYKIKQEQWEEHQKQEPEVNKDPSEDAGSYGKGGCDENIEDTESEEKGGVGENPKDDGEVA